MPEEHDTAALARGFGELAGGSDPDWLRGMPQWQAIGVVVEEMESRGYIWAFERRVQSAACYAAFAFNTPGVVTKDWRHAVADSRLDAVLLAAIAALEAGGEG